jgi:sugar O-acyltransferase (sialic acid O-acetyltransferase NeuD family)
MKKNLVICGTGSHARKVFQCASQMGYSVIMFVDENPSAMTPVEGIPVVSLMELPMATKSEAAVFVAIGRGDVRRRLMDHFASAGWSLPALIHPRAYVAPDAQLAEGVLVAAAAVIETGVKVARGVIVDIGVLIDHDCRIGEFCHLRPGEVLLPATEVGNTPILQNH